jgi:hypothetical protein
LINEVRVVLKFEVEEFEFCDETLDVEAVEIIGAEEIEDDCAEEVMEVDWVIFGVVTAEEDVDVESIDALVTAALLALLVELDDDALEETSAFTLGE